MKTIQIEAHAVYGDSYTADEMLRDAGVKRIHPGWYTVFFRGVYPDSTTVCGARRNRKGEIRAPRRET